MIDRQAMEALAQEAGEIPLFPKIVRSNHYNPVMNALISLDLGLLACRLFNSNELMIIGIMLNRDCKARGMEGCGVESPSRFAR